MHLFCSFLSFKESSRKLWGTGLIAAATALLLAIPSGATEPGSEALPFLRLHQNPASLAAGAASAGTAALLPFGGDRLCAGASYLSYMPSVSRTDYISGGISSRFGSFGDAGKEEISRFGATLNFTRGAGREVYGTDYKPSDLLLNAGFGWAMTRQLSIGLNLSYASQSLTEDYSVKAVAADIFLAGKFGGFSFAAGASSLGGGVGSEETGDFSLPASAEAFFAYDFPLAGKHGLRASLDADYYFSGAFSAALGAEYAFGDIAFARAGYRYGGDSIIPSFASAGLGFRFKGFELDAAYLFASETLGGSFALGLVFHL